MTASVLLAVDDRPDNLFVLEQGRLVKYSMLETEETLELAALLMAFCRQLDLALASDAVMERLLQAFKKEDYGLSFLRPKQAASQFQVYRAHRVRRSFLPRQGLILICYQHVMQNVAWTPCRNRRSRP